MTTSQPVLTEPLLYDFRCDHCEVEWVEHGRPLSNCPTCKKPHLSARVGQPTKRTAPEKKESK